MPSGTLLRLFKLAVHRGLIAKDPAMRLVKFLANTDKETVSTSGIIASASRMISLYAARCEVSETTGWNDLRRLIGYGFVRQLQAAAPGYTASYRVCYPVALVDEHMPDLPPGLARELPHRRQAEDDAQAQPPEAADPPGDADEHQGDDAPAPPCGELKTSPIPREGTTPGDHRTERTRRCQHRTGGKIGTEEEAQAADVLAACRRRWLAQRGPHRMPGRAELSRVETLTALALRHAGRGEVEQVLTELVGSAADLPAVLAWRLGRIVGAAGQVRQVAADDEGRRHAEMVTTIGNSAPTPTAATEFAALRARLGPTASAPAPPSMTSPSPRRSRTATAASTGRRSRSARPAPQRANEGHRQTLARDDTRKHPLVITCHHV